MGTCTLSLGPFEGSLPDQSMCWGHKQGGLVLPWHLIVRPFAPGAHILPKLSVSQHSTCSLASGCGCILICAQLDRVRVLLDWRDARSGLVPPGRGLPQGMERLLLGLAQDGCHLRPAIVSAAACSLAQQGQAQVLSGLRLTLPGLTVLAKLQAAMNIMKQPTCAPVSSGDCTAEQRRLPARQMQDPGTDVPLRCHASPAGRSLAAQSRASPPWRPATGACPTPSAPLQGDSPRAVTGLPWRVQQRGGLCWEHSSARPCSFTGRWSRAAAACPSMHVQALTNTKLGYLQPQQHGVDDEQLPCAAAGLAAHHVHGPVLAHGDARVHAPPLVAVLGHHHQALHGGRPPPSQVPEPGMCAGMASSSLQRAWAGPSDCRCPRQACRQALQRSVRAW